MDQAAVHDLIVESGAVLRGHFRLASGKHSDTYIEKFRVLERPDVLAGICESIVQRFASLKPDVVAGPSTGGIIVAYEVARQMGLHAVYVETENGRRVIKRHATIAPGARVLLVDDVLTTGISVRETKEAIEAAGAQVIGIGVLIDRSETPCQFGCDLFGASRFDAKTYDEDSLPADLASTPLTTPGTRAKLTV